MNPIGRAGWIYGNRCTRIGWEYQSRFCLVIPTWLIRLIKDPCYCHIIG